MLDDIGDCVFNGFTIKATQKQIICCRNIVHFVLLRKISESMLQGIVHLQPEHP